LTPIGTSGQRDNGTKRSIIGSGGQEQGHLRPKHVTTITLSEVSRELSKKF